MPDIVFTVNGMAIKTVRQFKYLGRVLDDSDSDLPAVEQKGKKAMGDDWVDVKEIDVY
jgi:hypothetical protein